MNNFIEYFYGIKINKVVNESKYYSFTYNGYVYRLYVYDDSINLKELININSQLVGTTLMSEIIYNRNNEVISSYNGISYILFRLFINTNKRISLKEIDYISLPLHQEKKNVNWGILWSKKIDYLEDLINENGKSYPLIVDSFNYFVGLAENAVEYFNTIDLTGEEKLAVSHKAIKFDDMVDNLYNPLNVIYDYRVRDVAEYIKDSFFNNNHKVFHELASYLQKNKLSLNEIKLLVARLLYPSFYFEMYYDILIDNKEEKILFNIIAKLDEYEYFLGQVIAFLKIPYNIDEIEWLKKRRP